MRLLFLVGLVALSGCIETGLPVSQSSSHYAWRPVTEPVTMTPSLKAKGDMAYSYTVSITNNTKVDLIIGISVTVSMAGVDRVREHTILVPAYKTRLVEGEALFDKLVWNREAKITVSTTTMTETE